MRKLIIVAIVILGMVSGCSLDKINPFSSDSSETLEQQEEQSENTNLRDDGDFTLSVHTVPEDVQISFKYYSNPFENGMALPNGAYTLIIEKPDYETITQNVSISGLDMELNVELKPILNHKYSLFINPDRKGCRIKIKNIKEKYKDEIQLENGKYHIEVYKHGFEIYRKWIVINDVDSVINVKLQKAVPRYSLIVKPNVKGAKIRIMNIYSKYKDHIKLPKGKYFIDVQKPGYQTFQSWVIIVDKAVSMKVDLLKL